MVDEKKKSETKHIAAFANPEITLTSFEKNPIVQSLVLTQKSMENVGLDMSFKLALLIRLLCKELRNMGEWDLSRQLFRCGTSVGANLREAQSPHSSKDFVLKLKIADKELRETKFWLDLIKESEDLPFDLVEITQIVNSITKILSKSISTAIANKKNKLERGKRIAGLKEPKAKTD